MYGILKKIIKFSGSRSKLLIRSMGISFVGALFSALQFLALMLTLDMVMGDARVSVLPVLVIMLVSIAGRMICFYGSVNGETEAGYFMVAEKRVHIGDRLRYIPMGYFNENSLGAVTAVVTTTLSDVENTAARCLVSVVGGFLNTFALALALCMADWRLGIIALFGIFCYLVLTEYATRATGKTGPERQYAQASLVEAVLEYIQGMGVVKSYGLERDNNQAAAKTVEKSCDKALALEHSVVPWSVARHLIVRLFSLILVAAALIFYTAGTLPLTRCLIMLVASFMIYQELESAGNMSNNLQMLGASMDKANSIDQTPIMDTDGQEITLSSTDIDFEHVSFSYGDRPILQDISFRIPAKTTTAVVGPSGGGKTTLCNLIARFWDVNDGSIAIGGRDIRELKLDSLMKHISMVFQNVYLFHDTVENNIKFGNPQATKAQVIEAAKAACCHDFIMSLPEGYDTVLSEAGGSLSGGERQRISIARAILKNAPIIILDEATASVDPENESELQTAIQALTHDKTIVMIAHRMKTVRHADQILVLDGGQIVQRGTHEELAVQPGLYADFIGERKEAAGWRLA